MNIAAEAMRMAQDPTVYFDHSDDAAHQVPQKDAEALQLAALKERFSSLRDRLKVLKATADEQGVDTINTLEDGVALVFPHTVYKSYPSSLLEQSRFDRLTKWLGGFTSLDLSKVDVSGCDGIDSWLDAMEAQTGLAISHSSGTSGTLSFLPRPSREAALKGRVSAMSIRDFWGLPKRSENEEWYAVTTGYRWGYSEDARSARWVVNEFTGKEENFFPLHDMKMSADIMYVAARVRRAQARGEIDQLQISPALRARQAEFEATQKSAAQAVDKMLERLVSLKGKKVYIGGQTPIHVAIAQRGIAEGHTNLFGSDVIIQTGGGAKGINLPDNWTDLLFEFTGASKVNHIYGMTEVNMATSKCSHGRYHIPPWILFYVLDPDSGKPLPREGQQTGRAAFFDLVPDTYWGGFVTGDEVTASWDPCGCGRKTVHMDSRIQRYSEKQGGDDKITCAAAGDAHAAAIDFLSQAS
jgi:hypothetical protein